MKVSIITPVWNKWEEVTRPFIEGLFSCTGDIELIIINNGSSDATKSELKKIKDSRLKVINLAKNIGFGAANNLGYAKATGGIVVFVNNDVIFHEKDWVKILCDVLMENKQSLVGMQLVQGNLYTKFRGAAQNYLNGWCVAGRKETFDYIIERDETREFGEIFDEGFGLAYFEDVELSVIAEANGISLIECNDLKIEHLGSKTSIGQVDIDSLTKRAQSYYLSKLTIIRKQRTNRKRFVFYAHGVPYPFIDPDYEGKGVGGAEGSLILLARELARLGHDVEIYNKTQTTGMFGGVWYRNINEINLRQYCDYFILFRSFSPVLHHVRANVKVFWSCDQYTDMYGTWNTQIFPYIDGVIAISEYHKKYLLDHYTCTKEQVTVLDLGVNGSDYINTPQKISGRAIFCSVPQRGLYDLLRVAPTLKALIPDFSLTITSDYRLWGLDVPDNDVYRFAASSMPYVQFLGKIERKKLVEEQLSAEVMAYPCVYDECFCISAMECIAAGAVPVTYDRAALHTTVGESGYLLSSSGSDEAFVQAIVNAFLSPRTSQVRRSGRERSKKFYWSNLVTTWLSYFDQLEQKRRIYMVTCDTCGKQYLNSFLLNKHVGKVHADLPDNPPDTVVTIEDMPTETVLRFKAPIEVCINGRKFVGSEVTVPYEYVDAVVEQARLGYGNDIVI